MEELNKLNEELQRLNDTANELKSETIPTTKPGYQSTEFWLTVASTILGTLVLAGKLTPAQSNEYITIAKDVAASIIIIIPQIMYFKSRLEIKLEDIFNKK